MILASLNRSSENVLIEAVIVAELKLSDRHKGQSLGNKPDRQGLMVRNGRNMPRSDIAPHSYDWSVRVV
jgi:hypothetical protein